MIKYLRGDITKIEADIIINESCTLLKQTVSVATRMVMEAGGTLLAMECKAVGSASLGEVVMTRAGNLPAQRIFHIPTIDMSTGRIVTYEELETAWREALTWCKANGFKTIATPLLGTSYGTMDKNKVKEILLKVSQEYQFDRINIKVVEHQDSLLVR